ncbi:MAG: efflux RND transporter permease subunit [Candidatus Methylomirabilis oxyfera]|nr:efflux RND transporter permease subunit [Candidatus Methylomirabilis oxyfera]
MLQRIFELSLENRFLVLILTALLVLGGVMALRDLPIDALPDITTVQVQILTETAPMGPVEVERYITFPIEAAMSGLPDLEEIRSISRFGLSAVTVVFKDHVNIYFARQLVAERLAAAKEQIPAGFGTPALGPVTTGLGEVYQFVVRGEGYTLMQLREILDWQIAYRLRGVPGVVEVSPEGGYEKQYHVLIDRKRLVSYRIPIGRVFDALEKNNAIAGGGYIEHNGEAYVIRGEGLVERSEDLSRIIVGVGPGGTPLTVAQLGEVKIDAMPRIGAATRNGEGEAVIAMTLMLRGGNGRVVAERIKEEVERMKPNLPPGIIIEPFYDRSDLVNKVIRTVTTNLIEGALLVIAVLLLLLGNLRGGLIVAAAIPLSMLVAFTGMIQTGISGNLMSLGAIDFGLIVDGAVVMIENIVRHLAEERGVRREERPLIILRAGREVLRPIFFAVSIIVIVYLPILTLQGVEGKMFKPMAFTVIFALIGSLILSFTLMPVLASLFLRGPIAEGDSWLLRRAKALYVPRLNWCVHHPTMTALIAASAFVVSLLLVPFLGGEFIPQLNEGDIVIQAWRLPSIALDESLKSTTEIERTLLRFPEVRQVVSRTGTPAVATDVMGMELSDIFVSLRPQTEWRTARTKEELIAKFAATLSSEVPGVGMSFSQPIEMRFNELIAGVRSDIGLKIFGDDLKVLKEKGDQAAHILRQIRGGRDVRAEQIAGLPVLRIQVDRQRIARYGINAADVLAAVEAAGAGRVVGTVFEGQRRFPLVVRAVGSSPTDLPSFQDLPVAAPNGALIPLAQLASVSIEEGPAQVSREDISRRIVVEANVRGRDLSSFVREAQDRIAKELTLPPGYHIKWGGQFENLDRATRRLTIVVPLSLCLIFVLLYTTFNAVRPALLIFLNVPLAVTGGVLALALRGLPFSISAGVGFIALFGVAVLNGVVLMSYILHLREEGFSASDAALKAAEIRLRPVLMTALVAGLGFVPMALSHGVGAEVQRPLATVVIGGLVTSTLLTLFVLPSLYRWFEREPADAA